MPFSSSMQNTNLLPALTSGMSFPLSFVPSEDYKNSRLGFMAARPAMGPRVLHGACDLIAPIGSTVYAVDDGVVVAGPYEFYLGVKAIEIKHSLFTVRYGEIKAKTLVKVGDKVTRGQPIAYVGKVGRGHMLHFEMYSGAEKGSLTVKGNAPFNRRGDLMDPAPFLDMWAGNLPKG